ncbi:hypothetical protein R1flu_000516 [Riccia fluitans]|uniref:SHSP domain-containing protein n=1 Tax=Riccia fluitans TaxID=41844 RepID=A0ABD1Y111_9MARC
MNMEQNPTVYLNTRIGCSKSHDMKSVSSSITKKKKRNRSTRSLVPRLSKRQEPSSSVDREIGLDDNFRLFGKNLLPRNQLKLEPEQVTGETETSADSQSAIVEAFGSLSRDIEEDEGAYVLEVFILDFTKEDVWIYVDNGELIIKPPYWSETAKKYLFRTNLSSSLTLPEDAMPKLITATQLEPGFLRLTIPKWREADANFTSSSNDDYLL